MAEDKDWTIMVYMAGDNNLSEDMINALTGIQNAMRSADSDDKLNVVAVYDSGYPTVPTTHYRFTKQNCNGSLKNCEIGYLHPQIKRRDRNKDGVIDEVSEINFIIDFVRWSVENWKANNYALIMTGHSDAVIGKTMFRDANPDKALNLTYLGEILEKSRLKLNGNKKFSLIGFDSCVMSMAEVGYELRNVAEVMVASEGDVPVSGWSYSDIFSEAFKQINDSKNFSGKDFAKIFVDKFIDYSQNFNIGGRSVSISACDLTEAENLRTSINNLAKEFNSVIDIPSDDKDEISDADILLLEKIKTIIHNSHYYSQTVMFEQAVDVSDFVQTLTSDCELTVKELKFYCGERIKKTVFQNFIKKIDAIKENCSNVLTNVNNYVFANGVSGSAYQFSSGVSLFFPWTLVGLYLIYSRYGKLAFSDDFNSEWFRFLENYNILTYRGIGEPSYKKDSDYLDWWRNVYLNWRKEILAEMNANKNVGGKNVGGKNVGGKNVGGKNVGGKNEAAKNIEARTEREGFYDLFGRFRNHPIDHDIVIKQIKK